MRNKKIISFEKIISLIVIFFSIASFGVIICTTIPKEYKWLPILPVMFLFCYCLFLIQSLRKKSIVAIVYIFLALIRYVIAPLFSVISGQYNGISYIMLSDGAITTAIFLMSYEILVCSIIIFFYTRSSYLNAKKCLCEENIKLKGNKQIYIIFMVVALLLFLYSSRYVRIVNFFVLPTNDGRVGDITSTGLVLLRQIILTAVIFAFLCCINYFRCKYNQTNKTKYVYYSIAVGLINISIIVGERRSLQIYTAFISIYVLVKLFTNHKKKIIVMLGSCALAVLILMSVYKFSNAFLYGSYSSALQSNKIDIKESSEYLQIYYYGPQNVGITVDIADHQSNTLLRIPFDFARSTLGLNFFVKGAMTTTSDVFNEYIYGKPMESGHLVSGVGYGYIYLGFVLAPIFVCLNIIVAFAIEKRMKLTSSLEMTYIWGYVLMRFCMNIYGSTPPLINITTIMLFTSGLLYFVARMFKKKIKIR